jgi:hypothetical protein
MKIPSEIFQRLSDEGLFKNYYHLPLIDVPDEELIIKLKRRIFHAKKESIINSNSLFVFTKSNRDIPLGAQFDVLFSLHTPEEFVDVTAQLKYVDLSVGKESSYLPRGYSAACLLEFDSVPALLNKLPVYNEPIDVNKHDMLYLSQKHILTEILRLMKEKV